MELYLQIGYGMMGHAKELIEKWDGGTIILSPRDMTLEQMINISNELNQKNGEVLLDPQFYQPHSDHDKLTNHSFWPQNFKTSDFITGNGLKDMLNLLWNDYNDKIKSKFFILPGRYSSNIDDDWKKLNDLIIEESIKLSFPVPKFATICLSSDVLRSEDQIHEILEHVETWEGIDGFYIIPEHPKGGYLVEDAIWLANLLDFCGGLKNIGKKVIVGYASHQKLCLSIAKVDAIASGTWLNVRMFPLEKFNQPEEESASRRTTWYYCPQALSEYQITFLDIAQKSGILNDLKADKLFGSDYSNILFSGAQPTTVNFSEREAFRHYLQCLKVQIEQTTLSTFDDTFNRLMMQLQTASELTRYFQTNGVRGKNRDFSNVVDINISALDSFKVARGFIFKNKWNDI